MGTQPILYAVTFWGSHPDENNDDCWCGKDFADKEAALAMYHQPAADYTDKLDMNADSQYIMFEDYSTGVRQIRKNPDWYGVDISDDDWARERTIEHLQLHGLRRLADLY